MLDIKDYLTDNENKILNYLNADIERWDLTAPRIKQSIRYVTKEEIEYILNHRALFQSETRNSDTEGTSNDNGRQK